MAVHENEIIFLKPRHFDCWTDTQSISRQTISDAEWQSAMGIYKRRGTYNGRPSFVQFGTTRPCRIEWITMKDPAIEKWAILRHGCGPFKEDKADAQIMTYVGNNHLDSQNFHIRALPVEGLDGTVWSE